jgi:iron(III) transport system substrate-binding protein
VLWVYNLRDEETSLAPFTSKYPFIEIDVWDGRGGEIIAKLVEEKKVGRTTPDILLLTSEISEVAEMGFFEEYEYPNAQGWDYQPDHNLYRNVFGNSRVFPYNTNNVSAADVPQTLEDLVDPKWQGRAVVSSSAEDTILFWAIMWREGENLAWERAETFWGNLIETNKPRVVSGFGSPTEMLAGGDFDIFMPGVSSSSTLMIRRGASVALAPIKEAPSGMSGIGIVKDAPHPNAAKLFIDTFTTAEGLGPYMDGLSASPLPGGLFSPEDSAAGRILAKAGIEVKPSPLELFTDPDNLRRSADWWFKAIGVK